MSFDLQSLECLARDRRHLNHILKVNRLVRLILDRHEGLTTIGQFSPVIKLIRFRVVSYVAVRYFHDHWQNHEVLIAQGQFGGVLLCLHHNLNNLFNNN